MGRPMKELLAELPIEEELVNALLGERCSATLWLELVRAFEKADWDKLGVLISENKLSALSIARNHLVAMQWANEVIFMDKKDC